MSYGAPLPARCPGCGWNAGGDLVVVDYTADPPPIPMRVAPAVFVEDRHVGFCRICDTELEPEALLVTARQEGRLSDVARATLARALANGHALAWDPPAAMTTMRRWTCTDRLCGSAVLIRPDGSGYGSALDKTCEEAQAFWAARS